MLPPHLRPDGALRAGTSSGFDFGVSDGLEKGRSSVHEVLGNSFWAVLGVCGASPRTGLDFRGLAPMSNGVWCCCRQKLLRPGVTSDWGVRPWSFTWSHGVLSGVPFTVGFPSPVPQKLEGSGVRGVGLHPKRIGLDQQIEDREPLSHGGGQGDFLEFACA